MKKVLCNIFVFGVVALLLAGCSKEETNELLQTEHVPGTEIAKVNTPTAPPTVPEGQEKEEVVTTPPTPTPFVPELITPMPTLMPEEPEFMNMYRAMPAGTRVNTEGMEEEQIRYCFYDFGINDSTKTAFLGQAGLDEAKVQLLHGVRVLYYRGDETKPYICDVVTEESESQILMKGFYMMYSSGQKAEALPESLPELLSGQGYRSELLYAGNVQYLYIYR